MSDRMTRIAGFTILLLIAAVFALGFLALHAGAQEPPDDDLVKRVPKAKVEKSEPAKPPKTEPFDLKLAPTTPLQLICQPRTAQCISCSDADPCYIYQGARRAVKE